MSFNLVQKDDASFELLASGASVNTEVRVVFADGVDVEMGRGTTDTDQTYIALRSPDGTKRYLVISDADAVSASTSRP